MGFLIFLVVMVALMWLLMIRPTQKRQQQTLELQRSISVGDEVVLTSGIFGTVVEDTEDHLGLEIAEGTTIRVLRGAIGSKVHRDDDTEPDTDAAVEADDTTTDTTTDAETDVSGVERED